MADELRHKDVGTNLSQAEWEAIGSHVFNSQATGDIVYASSSTQLTRLGITADRILGVSGGIPAWVNTLPAITLGGTVTLNGRVFDAGNGNLQINTIGNYKGLEIVNSGGGSGGANIVLKHLSSSPANNDDIANFNFVGYDNDSPANEVTYAILKFESINITEGAEEGKLTWFIMNAGALNVALTLSGAGVLDVVKYKVNGAAGANFSGAVTNITVVDGLVTSVT